MALLGKIVKEPLVHFLVIGALIFGLFFTLNDAPEVEAENSITVTPQTLSRLAAQFRSTWQRPATPEEMTSLLSAYVDEEVMVREARALSLDVGDTVIRQRLTQKMTFLVQSAAAAITPKDDDLQAHLEANAETFTVPPRISFRQVYLGQSADAATVEAARSALLAGDDPAAVGQASLLPVTFDGLAPVRIDAVLGRGVAAEMMELPTGEWAGPVVSGYGVHLVWIGDRSEPRLPPLDEIREQVELDWRAGMEAELAQRQLEAFRDRYDISLPSAEEIRAALQ